MAQQRPMSTPIFDELLREFAIRIEDQREPAETPAVPPPASPPSTQSPQPGTHRHRAD
jgi:hypothetical protein